MPWNVMNTMLSKEQSYVLCLIKTMKNSVVGTTSQHPLKLHALPFNHCPIYFFLASLFVLSTSKKLLLKEILLHKTPLLKKTPNNYRSWLILNFLVNQYSLHHHLNYLKPYEIIPLS